jgi:protein archease
MPWEHFSHQADMGIRGRGHSKEEAFEQAALALMAVITLEDVEPATRVTISCEDADIELLFAEWINVLVYEMATRKMLFSRFSVTLKGEHSLIGEAWGEPVDVAKHQPAVEVKGATYTALEVRQEADGSWVAQCVVDV